MGRPPLGVEPLTVRLTAKARARIEALVGKRRVAEYVRIAVDEKLEREGGNS